MYLFETLMNHIELISQKLKNAERFVRGVGLE